jgi:hypothetical protein
MEKRKLFFDEGQHKYTDELSNIYTSTTTLVGLYYEKFKSFDIAKACEAIGRNPRHPKYSKYKGKSQKEILHEWDVTRDAACDNGNIKHNYLEDIVKSSTGYKLLNNQFINDRIYTIDDIINDYKIGLLDIEYFESKGIKQRYPLIFDTIYKLTKLGYLIYSEIGVYDSNNHVSGLIDIFLKKGNEFIILDWKTNSMPITFETGYFEKDKFGKLTDNFISKEEWFYEPIGHIPSSVGHKYSMQLSGYAYMAELFGLKYNGSLLCHIRNIDTGIISKINDTQKEEIKLIKVLDLRNEFKTIAQHNYNAKHYKVNATLF